MDLRNQRILVVGLARTGIAAARFLRNRGALVRATDMATEDRLAPEVKALGQMGIALELGGHRPESFTSADLIVVSPGVPHTIPPLAAARAQGIPVIGEMELAGRFVREPIVAVSGTNGKTTVTEMVGAMLAASGRRVFVGGNIGTPLIGHVDSGASVEVVVAEVSSFQLDTITGFRPAVGVLLNITDDHLDRYPDFDAYAAAKMRLFENQRARDIAVLNGSDPVIGGRAAAIRSRKLFFSRSEPAGAGAAVAGSTLTLCLPGRDPVRLSLAAFKLPGPHNAENAAAASLAALVAGAGPEGIQRVLDTFAPARHRLEAIATVDGVKYVNDSKATNVNAVRRGLECFGGGVVLIMGGVDKGGDFGLLRDAVRSRGRALILLGGTHDRIRAALGRLVPTREAMSMREAVQAAREMAAAGDVVLLAPGCASFDLYANYQERGDDFRREVLRLKKSNE
ncbi:MAG: UDP-N-acetylmuramoyl-L-alanine--D-glutamate ligase [Hyphomicrobiales bacterium]